MTTCLYPHGISSGAILICASCGGEGYDWFWDIDDEDWVWDECEECSGSGVIWK